MPNLLRQTPIQNEPLLKNRFLLEFPSELNIPAEVVETAGSLKTNYGLVDVHEINSQTHVLGKVTFDAITITFKDHIGPSTAQKLAEWGRLHYEELTGRAGYAFGYKKTLNLKRLDPTGVEVSRIQLVECMLQSIDLDSYDITNAELVKPTIVVQPRMIVTLY